VAQEGSISGGRRAVTALFADVAGSTKLASHLDPEDVVEVVGGAVRQFCEVVESFGGIVKDLAGDGILALFGTPYAHEDDPERAVLAGLEIQRVVERHAQTVARAAGVDDFGVRVGIETGLVVIGPIGGGSHHETGATGDAVNVAARLQSHADIGTVLVGPETRRQLGDAISWGPTRQLELKGQSEIVEATVALGRNAQRADSDVPLVGRLDEMRVLTGAIDHLREGTGRTVFVVGEAGIGKSRLLAEARRHARHANVAWIEGQCDALEESTPFAGLRDLIRSAASSVVVEGEAGAILHRLVGGERGLDDLDRTPDAARFSTLAAVAAFATEATRAGPVVLCLEDLHWSDPSTLDALRRLRDISNSSRLLVVASMRIVQGHESRVLLAEPHADPAQAVLRLGPLADDDERRLLHELSGGALTTEGEEAVLSASDGVPLYLREFVRSVQDTATVATPERGVPPTLERLILARLDRLSPMVRDVVSALSVAGSTVDLEVAHAMVPGDDLDPALLELAHQGVMDVGATTCSFSHGLVQEVAYSTLLRERRKELHQRAAQALETSPKGHPDATLAHHWERAGQPTHAIPYHLAAADEAQAVSGLVEALGHVDAAVRLTVQLDAASDIGALVLRRATLHRRIGNVDAAREDAELSLATARERRDRRLELAALEELGFILAGAVDYRAATPLFDEALHLAEVLGDPTGLVSCHARLALAWTNRLRFDRGLEHAERALAIAQEGRSPELVPVALDALKQVELQIGDFPSAESHAYALLPLAERRGDLWSAQFCHLELGMIKVAQARWDEATSHLEEGLEVNRRVHDDGNTPAHLAVFAWLERAQGRYGDGLDLGKRAWDAALQRGHAEWTAWTAIYLGSLLLDLGATEEASDVLERGASAAERSGADLHGVRCFAHLGRARLAADDLAGAGEALGRADDVFLRVVLPPDRTFVFAWDAYIGAALIRATLGDGAKAAADLAPLIPMWERDGFREAVAEGQLAAARLATIAGDQAGGAHAAEASLGVAETAGLPGIAWRAHAFLSTFPEAGQDHAGAARSIVGGLTASLEDNTLVATLATTLERELGATG
jgi:class 3 adenylate cyclase/tetratricopeptide (TPR) repeat protein